MQTSFILTLLVGFLFSLDVGAKAVMEVYQPKLNLKGYLCKPKGQGPFPAVIYNHGGLGQMVGGDPRGTCEALAKDGFVGFSPMRRKTIPLRGHPQDVVAAIEFIKEKSFVCCSK